MINNFRDMNQQVFMELLRAYHDGIIGKTHAAEPQKEVANQLAKEAYFITLEYFRTLDELERG